MSRTEDWLPHNHEALFDKATETVNYMTDSNRARMGLGSGMPGGLWYDGTFVPAFGELAGAFTDWKLPADRTQNKTIRLQRAEEVFNPIYRKLYTGFLKDSPLVTDEDLNSMGLPTRSSSGRHPSPVPPTNPAARAITSQLRQVTIEFYEDDGAHKRAKPAGVHGAEIRWVVFDTIQTVHLDDLIHSSFDTRSPFTLTFADEQRGKVLYFALRWENTRGEKGPFGPIIDAVIP
jgi:hypothetical protein